MTKRREKLREWAETVAACAIAVAAGVLLIVSWTAR